MEPMKKPDFLVIPTEVMGDKSLTPLDVFVYGAIYWYTRLKLERCIASNQTIGEIVGAESKSVSNSVSRLAKAGYVQIVLKDGQRDEIVPRLIFGRQSRGGVHQPMEGGPSTNGHIENTYKDIHTVAQKKTVGSLKESVASKAVDNNIKSLFSFYEEQYVKRIDDAKPHFSWGVCAKLAKPLFKRFSLEELKRMVVAFLSTDNAFYRSTAWSLRTFLRDETINTLKSAIR